MVPNITTLNADELGLYDKVYGGNAVRKVFQFW